MGEDHYQLLQTELPPMIPGGAIIYCATRKQTEEVAAYLQAKEMAAAFFHVGQSFNAVSP